MRNKSKRKMMDRLNLRKRQNLSSHSKISKRCIMLRLSIRQMTTKKRRRNLKLRLNWMQMLPIRTGFNWKQMLRPRLKDSVSLLRTRSKGRDRSRKDRYMKLRWRLSELDSKRRRNTAMKRRNARGKRRKKSSRGKKKLRPSKRGSELRLRLRRKE